MRNDIKIIGNLIGLRTNKKYVGRMTTNPRYKLL
jgi:hypothetical protein